MKFRFIIAAVGAVCLLCSAVYSDPTAKDAVQLAPAKAAAISPDGTLIATGLANDIALWNAADGKSAGTLEGYKHQIYRLVFSRDGSLLAVSESQGKSACVFDVKSRKLLTTIASSRPMAAVGFSPDNAQLVTGGTAITVYSIPDGAVVKTIKIPANQRDFVLTPDGKEVICIGQFSGKLTAWDLGTAAAAARQFKQDAASTPNMGGKLSLAGPDQLAVASFMSQSVFVFDLHSGALDHKMSNLGLQQASFAPDGSRFAYGTWNTLADNCVCVADGKTGKPMVKIGPFSKDMVFAAVALSPDGKTLVAVPNEGSSPALFWHLQ